MVDSQPDISVVIPVYNAFQESRECIESVLRHRSHIQRLIIIDDCSPQGEFGSFLPDDILKDELISFHRNEQNLGFVKTCNLGMELAGDDDVILLNSDTLTTAGWAAKLQQAAYSRAEIGTVCPLSNNGVLTSVPAFCHYNDIPSGYSLDEFSELVERCSQKEYVELPTCMGFCVFLKRELINRLGGFDASAFENGYGEENDLSCRAVEQGYVNIADDATYIFHHGNRSFGEMQIELSKKNTEALKRRHPHYFDTVSLFCNRNPMRDVQLRILDELTLQSNQNKPLRVLHVLQDGPHISRREGLGGTELHVRDIINNAPEVSHWTLVPTKRCYFLSAHIGGCGEPGGSGVVREYILDLRDISLERIFCSELFDLVHLHHSRYYDHLELCDALSKHGNYVISFHDYILGCPRYHLYTPFRKVCNLHECTTACGCRKEYIEEYRRKASVLLDNARQLFHFSDSTRDYVTKMLGEYDTWNKVPHGIIEARPAVERSEPCALDWPEPKNPLRVAFVGNVPQHKGSLIAEELIKETVLQSGVPVEWHVIGRLFLNAGERVHDHGTYERGELHDRLKAVKPHIVLILSICPETYCLTLDESWNAGVPVVCTPLGAPAERMKAVGAGWILEELTAKSVLDLLAAVTSDWQLYLTACARLGAAPIQSVQSEVKHYQASYINLSSGSAARSDLKALLKFMRGFGLERPPDVGLFGRLTGRVVNKGIYLIDALRIRSVVERLFYACVPERLARELKSLR